MNNSAYNPPVLSEVKMAPPISIAISRVAWLDITSKDMTAPRRFFGRLSQSILRRKLKTNDHNSPEQNRMTANLVRLAVALKITRKLEAASHETSPAKELREHAMSAESITSWPEELPPKMTNHIAERIIPAIPRGISWSTMTASCVACQATAENRRSQSNEVFRMQSPKAWSVVWEGSVLHAGRNNVRRFVPKSCVSVL